MDNWLLIEMIAMDRVRERLQDLRQPRRVRPRPASPGGWRRALASALVRVGLALDREAAGGLPAVDITNARPQTSP